MKKLQILAICIIAISIGVGSAIADSYVKITQEAGQTTNPILVESSAGIDQFWVSNTGEIFTIDDINFESGTGFVGTLEHAVTVGRVWTMPDATGTVVLNDNIATLTGKSMSGASNTFTGLGTTTLNDDAVTYAKIQNIVSDDVFLGRISGANGDTEELTGTQATTLINVFTDALKGVAPASGGGTTNFLRADGSWVAPAGGSGIAEINTIEGGDARLSKTNSTTEVVLKNLAGVVGNTTLTNGTDTITFNLGTDVVMTGGSVQTVTKGITLNTPTLGGTLASAGQTIDNVGILNDNSGDEADAGFLRLGNTAIIGWEADPAGTDLTITSDTSENFVWNSGWNNIDFGSNPLIGAIAGALFDLNGNDLDNVDQYFSDDADPADTANAINLGNTDLIAFEANPAGTDLTITSDASENFVLNTAWNDIDFNLNPLIDIVSIANSASFVNFIDSINVTSGDINMTGTNRALDLNTNKLKGSSGCTDGQIREYSVATDYWECATDDGGASPTDIISEGDTNVETIDAGTGEVQVDVDGANQYRLTASFANFTDNELSHFRNHAVTLADSYTLTNENEIVILNPSTTAFTVTLPTVSGTAGKHYKIIYNATTGTKVTIDGNGAESINGNGAVELKYPFSSLDIYSTGLSWHGTYSDGYLNTTNQVVVNEEWLTDLGTSITVGNHGDLRWTMVGVGTETGVYVDGESGHMGIKRIGTTGALGDDADIFMSNAVGTQLVDADDTFDITWIVRVPTITTMMTRLGLTVTPTSNSEATVENAMFIYSSQSGTGWTCMTRTSGGTNQFTNTTSVVTANQWYELRIVKDALTIRFLIDDTNVCNHSTAIPTSVVTPFATVETWTTSARTLDLDLFQGNFRMVR